MVLHTTTIESINKLARKIARLTDNNNHNESVLVLAKFLEEKEAIEKMEEIKAKHIEAGGMVYEWIQERTAIRKGLMSTVVLVYGLEARDKINGCF